MKKNLTTCLLVLSVFVSGCGSLTHSTIMESGVSALPKEFVFVGDVKNFAAQTPTFDYAAYYRDSLKGQLSKRAILISDELKNENVVLETNILEYQAGNAFKRWLMPAYGSTVCTVRVDVLSGETKEKLATINVRRTIVFGGLYTLGAYKTVFDNIAKAVAEELSSKLVTT